MKILQQIIFSVLVCLASYLQASDWSIAAEASYANLSGVRAYEASPNQNRNESEHLIVPSLLVSKRIGDKSELSLRYTLFDRIDGSGVSPHSNILRKPGVGERPSFTHYILKEEMHELTLSYLYDVWRAKNWSVRLGPNLSLYDSEAEFFLAVGGTLEPETKFYAGSGRGRQFGTRSSSDLAIGLEANATLKLTDRMGAELGYRFSNPPDRDIHLVSLALKFYL